MNEPQSDTGVRALWKHSLLRWGPPAFIAACLLALAGRILSYPLGRDENLFVTVSQQLPLGDMYRDLGYNHLPNFVLLLGSLFQLTGTDHYLLAGRLLIVAGWGLTLAAIWLVGRRLHLSRITRLTAMSLLIGNITMLGPPGMLATNSLWPIPLAILSFYFLLGGLDERNATAKRMRESLLAGVAVSIAIGFKANFIVLAGPVALATLLAPRASSLVQRLRLQVLPLVLGGTVGGLPAILAFLRDPEGMIAHTIVYFTDLHKAFWFESTEPKALSLAEKLLLAEDLWLSNGVLLTFAGIALFALAPLSNGGWRSVIDRLWTWPVVLCFGLAACGLVVSFVPTPSFTQYFLPPVPFLLLLFLALAPRASGTEGGSSNSELAISLPLFALAMAGASSRLLPGLLALAQPGGWPGLAGHGDLRELLAANGIGAEDRVATMTPILALEGGAQIYAEFAAGQFVYRVVPYMSEEDRAFYRTTSADELAEFLDGNPPAAILVNHKEPIEQDLANYARSRDFSEITRPDRAGMPAISLFLPVRTDGSNTDQR